MGRGWLRIWQEMWGSVGKVGIGVWWTIGEKIGGHQNQAVGLVRQGIAGVGVMGLVGRCGASRNGFLPVQAFGRPMDRLLAYVAVVVARNITRDVFRIVLG